MTILTFNQDKAPVVDMPVRGTYNASVFMKLGSAVSYRDTDVNFYSTGTSSTTYTDLGYQQAVYASGSQADNPLTVISKTNFKGRITSIMLPNMDQANTTITATLVVDGKYTYKFTKKVVGNNTRILIGDFRHWGAVSSAIPTGVASNNDEGFSINSNIYIPNPVQSAVDRAGIPVNKSFKLSIYTDVATDADIYQRNTSVFYTYEGEADS